MLAQVITDHRAVIIIENGVITSAICDNIWDLIDDESLQASITGIVIGGGDTSSPGGPLDVPRMFVYEVKKDDGTTIKVSYMAYPPSRWETLTGLRSLWILRAVQLTSEIE